MMQLRLLAAFAALLATVIAAGISQQVHAAEDIKILVVVNGEPITNFDLAERLQTAAMSEAVNRRVEPTPENLAAIRRDIRDVVLNDMVETILLEEEISRLQLTVEDEYVDAYMDQIIAAEGLANEEELGEKLKLLNQTVEQFRERIRTDMLKQRLVQGMVGSKLVITDTQIEEVFAKSPEYSGGKRYGLRVIMVESPEKMDEVLEIIDDGDMTFEEVAMAHSVGPMADDGGDMGTIALSGMSETWRRAVGGVETGERSEPFEADGMQVVLWVYDISAISVDDVPGLRDKIFNDLREKKMSVLFDEYMERLRERAVIDWK